MLVFSKLPDSAKAGREWLAVAKDLRHCDSSFHDVNVILSWRGNDSIAMGFWEEGFLSVAWK